MSGYRVGAERALLWSERSGMWKGSGGRWEGKREMKVGDERERPWRDGASP